MGDCTLGGDYGKTSETRFEQMMRDSSGQLDYHYNMQNVVRFFEDDDVTVANLEVVLTTSTKIRKKNDSIAFYMRGKPEYVNILTENSIEVVNIANNHTKDFDTRGLEDTVAILEEAGVDYCGFGYTCARMIKGVKVGFAGIYSWSCDEESIERLLGGLREEGCELIIASCHLSLIHI